MRHPQRDAFFVDLNPTLSCHILFLMQDIVETVAKNLADLRKSRNLTQGQLAERFSYSDKAISKWEHGETLPDLGTLQQLADFYGVTIDYLTHEPTEDNRKLYSKGPKPTIARRHWFAMALTLVCIFFVATVATVAVYILHAEEELSLWLPFVWAAAGACFSLSCFFTHWRLKNEAVGWWVVTDWAVLTSIYVSMGLYLPNGSGWALWVIYIIGAPVMVGLLLSLRYQGRD
jgi:transcriptional regulator with XRE-family HTH domain